MVRTVLRDLVRALEGRQRVYRDHVRIALKQSNLEEIWIFTPFEDRFWGPKLANFRSIIFPSLADDPFYLTKVFDKSCAHAQKVQNSVWCL